MATKGQNRKLTKETLDDERLRNAVDTETYNLGNRLFSAGEVKVEQVTDTTAVCIVSDRREYHTRIQVKDNYLYLKCDCLHASRGLICEHELAACFAVRAHLIGSEPPKWQTQMERMMRTVREQRSIEVRPYLLFFSLQRDPYSMIWQLNPYRLSARALLSELHGQDLPEDPYELQLLIHERNLITRLKTSPQSYDPDGCLNCSREAITLANVIQDRARAERGYFTQPPLKDYLTLIANLNIPLFKGEARDPLSELLHVHNRTADLSIQIERAQTGIQLTPKLIVGDQRIKPTPEKYEVVHSDPLWLLVGNQLFELKETAWIDLIGLFSNQPVLRIPQEGENDFLDKYYLKLARTITLEGDLVEWQDLHIDPIPRVYLSDEGGELRAELRLAYGDIEVDYHSELPTQTVKREPNSWVLMRIHRNKEKEEAAFNDLSGNRYGLKRFPTALKPNNLRLRARVHPVDFLLNKVPLLARKGYEVFGEEQLKTARVNRSTPSISFNISSGIDWFDVNAQINFGEVEVSFKEMRRAMRKRQRYIKLSDGSIGEIPEDWFEHYKHLFALGEVKGERMRFSRFHLPVIDQSLKAADQILIDDLFKERRERIQRMRSMDFTGLSPVAAPEDFTGDLRPYQKAGYDWLHFLREYRFGGCLADDMGLGKTIQALAFLQSLYHGSQKPPETASLLVVPRSLLINWQREAERFTPQLRIQVFFSSNRKRDYKIFNRADVIITTYGIMLRDIEFLHGYTFHYAILDESQAIKNPLSQTARASRLLQADHRLALTGTPIENSTVELWSQFAFLNPGLLGSLEYFKNEFGSPIERQGDETATEMLRQLVYPFILRRTKEQVAPELPPRSERVLYSDMQPAQRKLYNRTRDYYRGMLLGMIDDQGMDGSRMHVLEGLLRLRQISNHPRLMEKNFRGPSGKFDLLFETLETLISEGHKALVFSQFVQMLTLVRSELDKQAIPYAYLDGKTANRQEIVDNFQDSPELPLFLISLKAGGLGLNLTAADYVIHIDPWWNPAVEMQASDRTHRIGQDKPVFIYKLITRDSVEEKIVQLQERKKNLVDQIITTEASFFKSLTKEDIEVLFSI